jgi:UDP-N-acetylmuramoyl-tripeptide--D-alanyl-D-alanine ligase
MAERPIGLTLADLVAALAGVSPGATGIPAVPILSSVVDSRQATPGSLFIALRGSQADGHDYIPAAIANGAAVVLAERLPAGQGIDFRLIDLRGPQPPSGRVLPTAESLAAPGRPVCLLVDNSLAALQQAAAAWRRQVGDRVSVIGITGSVGKTTSKETVATILGRRYRTLKSEGNYNNEIGLPLTLLHLTTEHEQVVLEMGMYDLGEIRQLAAIALPRIGLVTNVGPSHLERLGTIERIAQAKSELPQALPPAAQGGVCILNADDARVLAMAGQTQARVMTYGLSPEADLWADEIESEGLEGIRFRLHAPDQVLYTRVPLLGRHSVHTALAGAAVALAAGLSWEDIIAGLQDQPEQLRLIAVPGPAGSTLLDDTYNASPASSIAALNLLAELSGRKVAVLGDMYELGSYAEEGHRLVGRRARDVLDLLVTVGPLGRLLGLEALEAGMPADAVHMVDTNAQAAALLQSLVRPGDLVLIKGSRGMRMDEIVASIARPAPAEDNPRQDPGSAPEKGSERR